MSLKRSRGEGDLTALAPPIFAASSAAKRRRTDSGPSSASDRRDSFDCLTAKAESWDSALLSAYMVDSTSTPVSIDEDDAPQWSGSWAGHSAQMAFLFGKRAPPPRPPSRTVEEVDYDASDDEAAEGDVNKVARAFAKGHRLRRGFFASALRRRLQTLQETNQRLKAIAREHLDESERTKLFAELGSEDNSAITSRDESMARTDLCLVKVIQEAQRSFCVTDPRQPDNPIVWASDAFLRMTGYQRDEVIGRNCRFLQGPRTDPRRVGEIRDAVAGEHECLVTLLNYRKDGETFWNRFFIAPLRDSEGAVTYYVGVQVDVSEAIAASASGLGALG